METRFKTYQPDAALQPYIEQFWVLERKGSEQQQPMRVLPNGCPEFLFYYGDPFELQEDSGAVQLLPRAVVRGQLKKHIITQPTGRIGIFGVRFRPSGLYSLMGRSLRDLTHRCLGLEEVYGAEAGMLARQVLTAADTAGRIRQIEQFFESRIADPDTYAPHAIHFIRRSGGQVTVADLSRRLGIGERQVERNFNETIGLSPKYFIRITRLNNALNLLRNHPSLSWADLAYECGYSDQAHFINEFRTFAGEPPRQFFARPGVLAEVFPES